MNNNLITFLLITDKPVLHLRLLSGLVGVGDRGTEYRLSLLTFLGWNIHQLLKTSDQLFQLTNFVRLLSYVFIYFITQFHTI